MRISKDEKARRYDVMIKDIKNVRAEYVGKLKEVQDDLEKASDNVACMFIGKKFAYMDFIKDIERWLNV